MKTPDAWPQRIEKGNARVTIYRHQNSKGEKTYEEFKVAYYTPDGRRRMESFADYADALKKANTVTASINRGDAKALTLTSEDRLVYLRAVEAIKPTGLTLDLAAHMVAEAWKHLQGGSLVEAARYYAKSRKLSARFVSLPISEAAVRIAQRDS